MAGTITALQIQKRNKERVNVFLEGEFAFAVTVLVAATLRKGQHLDDAEITRLKHHDVLDKAYNHGLRFLGFRARSRREMEQYLRGKGYEPEVIDYTVNRLTGEGYVDDEAFARYWLENRESFRPRSQQYLRHELRQKGISPDIIDTLLTEVDETESAWRAAESKLSRWRGLPEEDFKKKMIGFLNRRGFSYEVAREVTDRAWLFLDAPE